MTQIRNQEWTESTEYLILSLREPYWGAWQKYGWERGVEGLSVSLKAVEYAESLKKNLVVILKKYGIYRITPERAQKFGKVFVARDNKGLLCIPRTAFTKIKQSEIKN